MIKPTPINLDFAQQQSQIWQHVESGGLYYLETDVAITQANMARAAIYRSLWDGQVWVCTAEEFFDGRFRNLAVDEVTDCRPLADRGAA